MRLFLLCMLTLLLGNAAFAQQPTPVTGLGKVLSVDPQSSDGVLHLLVGEASEAGEPMRLLYLRSVDDGATWSNPAEVPTGHAAPGPHHRGTDARLAVRGNHLVATWTTSGKGAMGTGPLATAVSHEAGRTWQAGGAPGAADFDAHARHGHRFPALAADPQRPGVVHVAWIDAYNDARSLRASRSTDGGLTWQPAVVVDSGTCACCWNSMVVNDGSVHVLYRDMNPSDMKLGESTDSGVTWSQRPAVGDFRWRFDGCPHVGGGLALGRYAGGQRLLHAAVWTGAEQAVGAYVQHSRDGGASWSRPHPLGTTGGSRHADIAADEAGLVVAVWDEAVENGRVIAVSMSRDSGETWSAAEVLTDPGAWASHPRVKLTPRGAAVFWTQGENSTLMSALLPIKAM